MRVEWMPSGFRPVTKATKIQRADDRDHQLPQAFSAGYSGPKGPTLAQCANVLPLYFGAVKGASKVSFPRGVSSQEKAVLTRIAELKGETPTFLEVLAKARQLASKMQHEEVTPLHLMMVQMQQSLEFLDSEVHDGTPHKIYESLIPEFLGHSSDGANTPNIIKLNINGIVIPELQRTLKSLPMSGVKSKNPPLSPALLQALEITLDRIGEEAAKWAQRTKNRIDYGSKQEKIAELLEEKKRLFRKLRNPEPEAIMAKQAVDAAQAQVDIAQDVVQGIADKLCKTVFKKPYNAIVREAKAIATAMEAAGEDQEKLQAIVLRQVGLQAKNKELQGKLEQYIAQHYPKEYGTLQDAQKLLKETHTTYEPHFKRFQRMGAKATAIGKEYERFKAGIRKAMKTVRNEDILTSLMQVAVQQDLPYDLAKEPTIHATGEMYRGFLDSLMASAGGGSFINHDMVDRLGKQAKTLGAGVSQIKRLVSIVGDAKRAIDSKNSTQANRILHYARLYAATPWEREVQGRKVDWDRAKSLLSQNSLIPESVRQKILAYIQIGNEHGWDKAPVLMLTGGWGQHVTKKAVIQTLGTILKMPTHYAQADQVLPIGANENRSSADVGMSIPVQAVLATGTTQTMVVLDKAEEFIYDSVYSRTQLNDILSLSRRQQFQDPFLQMGVDLAPMVFVATSPELDIETRDYLFNDKHVFAVDMDHTLSASEKVAVLEARVGELQKETGTQNLKIDPEALETLARDHTFSGLTDELEHKLKLVLNKAFAHCIEEFGKPVPMKVTKEMIKTYLGVPVSMSMSHVMNEDAVGDINGLAAFPGYNTGAAIQIQITELKKTKRSKTDKAMKYQIHSVNGPVGDMMKDSAQKAVEQYLLHANAQYKRLATDMHNYLFAVNYLSETEGPSAGLAMSAALVSRISGIPVRKDVAMTGTVDARGNAGQIGGVYEKVLGAVDTGKIKTVLVPRINYEELKLEHPRGFAKIQQRINVIPVDNMDQVLRHTLVDYDKLHEPAPAGMSRRTKPAPATGSGKR